MAGLPCCCFLLMGMLLGSVQLLLRRVAEAALMVVPCGHLLRVALLIWRGGGCRWLWVAILAAAATGVGHSGCGAAAASAAAMLWQVCDCRCIAALLPGAECLCYRVAKRRRPLWVLALTRLAEAGMCYVVACDARATRCAMALRWWSGRLYLGEGPATW